MRRFLWSTNHPHSSLPSETSKHVGFRVWGLKLSSQEHLLESRYSIAGIFRGQGFSIWGVDRSSRCNEKLALVANYTLDVFLALEIPVLGSSDSSYKSRIEMRWP